MSSAAVAAGQLVRKARSNARCACPAVERGSPRSSAAVTSRAGESALTRVRRHPAPAPLHGRSGRGEVSSLTSHDARDLFGRPIRR